MLEDPFILLVLALSAFVHGAFGFGFPLLATPLLVLGLEMRTAVMLTLLPNICINLFSILGETHWRRAMQAFWPIPAFTIVGSFIGTQVLLNVDPEPFRLLLAAVLVAWLISDSLRPAAKPSRWPPWALALFGLTLGLLAGVVNVFSPLVVAFALHTRMPQKLMVATFNLTFITSKSGQLIGFASSGALVWETLRAALLALPLVLLALWLGIRLRRRLPVTLFRQLLRAALWVMSVALILDVLLR